MTKSTDPIRTAVEQIALALLRHPQITEDAIDLFDSAGILLQQASIDAHNQVMDIDSDLMIPADRLKESRDSMQWFIDN